MAVRVDDVNGVAGFVLPEARVDVLLTGSPKGRAELGQITRTILSKIRVISAGEHLAPDASGRPQRVPVVTLLLTPRQAEMLTLASSHGRIQLVLRNSMDPEQIETKGVREQELFVVAPPRRAVPIPSPPTQIVRLEPSPQIELIRGSRRSVQSFDSAQRH